MIQLGNNALKEEQQGENNTVCPFLIASNLSNVMLSKDTSMEQGNVHMICERRERSYDEHFENLSNEQLDVVYSLIKMGFQLWFVRRTSTGESLAVLKQANESDLIEVDHHGKMTKELSIQLRQNK